MTGFVIPRIGHGYDVHAFTQGTIIVLGGVKIEHKFRFKAHSDGDVLLHALCDALLGAAALGDIGQHFPDTDNQYKNKDSRFFLLNVYKKILEQGLMIGNIDITIVAQQPKLAPHLPKMKANIMEDCYLQENQINIKATTTEKLGFCGREEGIAVHAVALLVPVGGES
ncbi:MAG: 2-C-methyl-D-erythritol 2,4-cyclodiphosphate synthase [Gammaproteobacteria bacterium]|nr:2-C-methyl-D-erythritol 2,4-cyclodiphosphate synthase [Gammaproteobacteria bacterium]